MKLIEKHEAWMKKGKLNDNGLCISISDYDPNNKYFRTLVELFRPSQDECEKLEFDGYSYWFWASGLKENAPNIGETYTPLRQAIVLLICAMHNEL